jgi:hypothetical protein
MAKKHGGLYDESPTIKGEEEGKPKVVKASKTKHEDTGEEKGVEGEAFPIHARHSMERTQMHGRHEMEHDVHEHKHGMKGKEAMHDRHEKDMKEMHTRHEKESQSSSGAEAGMGGSEGKGSGEISKVEKKKE